MASNDLNHHRDPDSKNGNPHSPVDSPPASRLRKSLILKILATLTVAVVLLILMLPTLASTGIARQMAIDWLNGKMAQGQAQIKDWSFSWRNGLDIRGISFEDASGSHLLNIGHVTSSVSPWRLLLGRTDLGEVQITGVDFNARVDESGQLNLISVFKPSAGPMRLPDVKGTFHISGATGTLNNEISQDSWVFDSIDATITIKDIDQPIDTSITTVVRLMNQPLGAISVDGAFSAKNGFLDLPHLSGNQNIAITRANVASMTNLFRRWGHKVEVAGTLDSTIRLILIEGGNLSFSGTLAVADPSVTGEDIDGDTVYYSTLVAQFTGSRSAGRMQLNLPVTGIYTAATRPDHMEMQMDIPQDSIRQASRVLVSLLNRSLKGESTMSAPVGDSGTMQLKADFDRNNIMFQLADVFHITPGDLLSTSLSRVRAATAPATRSATEP